MINITRSTSRDTKDLGKDLMDFWNSHKEQEWGNSIIVKEPERREGFFDFAHILFINFWQSLCRLDEKYILHEDLSIPQFKIKNHGKNQVIVEWSQRTFIKK